MSRVTEKQIPGWLALVAAFACCFSPGLRAADPVPKKLAVGPFFAPASSDSLRQTSKLLPELLLEELSHLPRFQMVERERVRAVWLEMDVSASGLAARETVVKLGGVLACDWLISGSLVEASGRTHVWTKVIDVRTGVILDLSAIPYEAATVAETVTAIAAFIDGVSSQSKRREFITMGPFVELTPPLAVKREDWTRRLSALIEKHFLDAGYGVVEMAAVGPIFEERRLETAGLTGHPEERVKLQAAFWFVDGGCEWIDGQSLAVGMRIQQVGGPEQIIRLTNAPGPSLEKSVLEAINQALARTNPLPAKPDAEADLLAIRGRELAERRSPFLQKSSKTRTQWDQYKQMAEQSKRQEDNRAAALANYERALLRDPNDIPSKSMLGMALLGDPDATRRPRGKELLSEVVASKDPTWAERAHKFLTNAALYARSGDQSTRTIPRPTDWASINQAFQENPSDLEARYHLGAGLLNLMTAEDRSRGRQMLSEVAAGNRLELAERARKLLAQPERSPALANYVRPTAPAPTLEAQAEEPPVPLIPEEAHRTEFLQTQFARFVPIKIPWAVVEGQRDVAPFQTLRVQQNMIAFEGWFYCGFRFTLPEWFDGDLRLMNVLAKTEAQKDFSAALWKTYLIPEHGQLSPLIGTSRIQIKDYKILSQRFPYTQKAFTQEIAQKSLKPGQQYAIWFGFQEKNLPDIAFALTVASARGRALFGVLPLQ